MAMMSAIRFQSVYIVEFHFDYTFKYPVVSTILVTNSRVPIQLLRNYSRHLLAALVGNERIRLVPSIFCRFPLTPRPTYERVYIFFLLLLHCVCVPVTPISSPFILHVTNRRPFNNKDDSFEVFRKRSFPGERAG